MAKTTIYLPDELAERLKMHPEINVSGLAQEAVRGALDAADAFSADEMTELVVDGYDRNGNQVEYSFVGREIAFSTVYGMTAYLMQDGSVHVSDPENERSYTLEPEQMLQDLDEGSVIDDDYAANVAEALGRKRRIRL
jgi:hypothetical protein